MHNQYPDYFEPSEETRDSIGLAIEAMFADTDPDTVTISPRIAIGPVCRITAGPNGQDTYHVRSDHPKSCKLYIVKTLEYRVNSCTCEDFRRRSYYHPHICKHMRAVEIEIGLRLSRTRERLEAEIACAYQDYSALAAICERYQVAVYECPAYLAIQRRLHTNREKLRAGMRYLSSQILPKL